MSQANLNNLINRADFQKSEAGERLFPTMTAIDWFIRVNKARLIEQKAILKLRGQWFLVRPEFDQTVIDIAAEKTRSHIEA